MLKSSSVAVVFCAAVLLLVGVPAFAQDSADPQDWRVNLPLIVEGIAPVGVPSLDPNLIEQDFLEDVVTPSQADQALRTAIRLLQEAAESTTVAVAKDGSVQVGVFRSVPDQTCNPGCFLITVYHTCNSGVTPTYLPNYFAWDMRKTNGTHEGGQMSYLQYQSPRWRIYDALDTTFPTGSYQGGHAPDEGPWAWQWSYGALKTINTGYSGVWDFWRYSAGGEADCLP